MERSQRLQMHGSSKENRRVPAGMLFYFPIAIFYLELVFRIFIYKSVLHTGVIYSALFAVTAGLVFYFLSTLFSKSANLVISAVLMLLLTLLYATQYVYYLFFKTPLSLYSVGEGGQVAQFFMSIVQTVFKNIIPILLMLVPLVFLFTYARRRFSFQKTPGRFKVVVIVLLLLSYGVSMFALFISGRDVNSAYTLYFRIQAPDLAQPTLGVLTNARLDMQRLIFGFTQKDYDDDSGNKSDQSSAVSSETNGQSTSEAGTSQTSAVSYKPNVMNIDFDTLIANETDKKLLDMHKYFSTVEPTLQNEYTGIFKGCNLIFITAESFSRFLVNKDVCPTIYKLATEGLQFTNFYNPVWGVSTSDGEYVACTGLIPKSGVWSFKLSGSNYMPFCMGRQFAKIGYPTPLAYHDHTYTYYGRNISHPNMGYIYKGLGNGLDVKRNWPESDVEMMQKTIPTYINEPKFHVYYMTVSGHLNYSFKGNYQAYKHKSEVANLDLPEDSRAYLACNIELDNALAYLLQQLTAEGKINNTVIVISPDHYPYGLSEDGLNALAGHTVERNFELYKSTLVIWKNGMTHTVIDKPVCSMDIIPTISNMFGLEYDSRLLMGRDIFSTSPPLVIFSNRSWITDKASYNSQTGEVKSLNGEAVTDEYVSMIKKMVSNKFKYSAAILDNNYYAKVLK